MYLSAPINKFYEHGIKISEGKSEITVEIKKEFFHAANAAHGSVYFKMLDDAAYFAASSNITDVFLLTGSFDIKLLRPVNHGTVVAMGELVENFGNKLVSRAKLVDSSSNLIATGKGVFVKSSKKLEDIESFKL